MFQPQSISTEKPDFLVADLIHQLELNPDITVEQILEEFKEGLCFDGKVTLTHKLPPIRQRLVKEGHEIRVELDKLRRKVSNYIKVVAENEM